MRNAEHRDKEGYVIVIFTSDVVSFLFPAFETTESP